MVWRRKWVVLLVIVLVPAAAVALSVRQPKLYQASARVLLSWQNLANELTGTAGSSVAQQPDRLAQTQAAVAQTTDVAKLVLAKVPGAHLTAGGFLADSSVSTNPNADILIFDVTNGSPAMAATLANEYAKQYTVYRRTLDNAAIVRARASIRAALKRRSSRSLHADLLKRDQTLATMQALQTSNASVVQLARGAAQIQPRTKRNAILAAVLGLILALVIAYLWETLDTRVRQTEDISKYLGGVPLLARIAAPSRRLEAEGKLVTMEEPDGPRAESFRILATNLGFVTLDRHIQSVMVTSAIEGEGKSLTIANLAVTLARSGQRVALVDLDLRRPRIDTLFRLSGPGVTQVAMGWETLENALVQVRIPSFLAARDSRAGYPQEQGSLEVLPAGAIPPDRAAFVDSRALTDVLQRVRERVDILLIDGPPALAGGGAAALSRKVDGILVVTRVNVVRRPMLQELARIFALMPAHVLGFVATGIAAEPAYEYAYGSAPATVVKDRPTTVQEVGDVAG
jgi:capsular exopolysaccharide synthesis family protein